MLDKNQFLINLYEKRYTCKGYDKNKKVSDEDFKTIMELARLSPSSMGYEPWKFIRLKNREVIEKIRPYSWGAEASFDGASHIVLILARMPEDLKYDSQYLNYIQTDIQKYPEDMLKARKERYLSFQEEDYKLLESNRALFDWACKQCYIPLTSMLIGAATLGIDSTPIEGFNQDKVNDILVENGVYDGEHFKIACMVAFGYTNREHREKTRRPIEEVYGEF